MTTIRIKREDFQTIQGHLHRSKTEQVVFLFLSPGAEGQDRTLEVAECYPVPTDELVFESEFHAEVTEKAQAKVIKLAWEKQLCLGEIHSHPHRSRDAAFSPSDLAGFEDFVPHVWWRLKGKPYVAFVFGRTDFDALAWLDDPHNPTGIDRIEVGNKKYAPTGITIRLLRERQEQERVRYSRQSAFFGEEGQRKISACRVAIVGLGGLGSYIAQQLAYLGVKQYALIDEDHVSRSNLNRLIGATENDLDQKKVEVSSRLIRRIQPGAEIVPIDKSLLSPRAFAAIREADVVFGCVDDDGVRMVLLELCCTCRKPYVDIASDIPDVSSFGGRLVFTGLGKGCTMCRGELDQREIRRFFATPEQRQEDDRIYGVERAALGGTGPSVVSLNGTLASIAVTEFIMYVTKLRPTCPYLVYRGEMGVLTKPTDPPAPNCYYCDGVWSGREKSEPERYLRISDVRS